MGGDEAAGQVIRRIEQVPERGRAAGAAVVAHDAYVARHGRSRGRAPPEVGDVYGAVLGDGGTYGRTVLPQGGAGFDAT